MNTRNQIRNQRPSSSFTLIELLIVIAIISILAALVVPVAGHISVVKIRSRARAELASVETMIESYKTKWGFFPPSDSGPPPGGTGFSFPIPSLYFELLGTTYTNYIIGAGPGYITLDGSAQIPTNMVNRTFGNGNFGNPSVDAILNCSRGSGDEAQGAVRFYKDLKTEQGGVWQRPLVQPYALLGTTLPAPEGGYKVDDLGRKINPWRYRSPGTNNPNSFDLWIVVKARSQTNIICNWTKTPLVVNRLY